MNDLKDPVFDCAKKVVTSAANLRSELEKCRSKTDFAKSELSTISTLAYEVWIPLLYLPENDDSKATSFFWTDRELAANFKEKLKRIDEGLEKLNPSAALVTLQDIENRVTKHAEDYARYHHLPNPTYLKAAGPDGLGGIHKPVGGPKE